MGGEKHQSFTLLLRHRGSPPHGRGKGRRRCRTGDGFGITPAWAGKRWGRCADTGADRDHPRMGGEKITRIAPKNWGSGSPPRRRGKGAGNGDLRLHDGITPAWAGKSWERTLPPSEPKAHPRVGGEKLLTCERIDFRLGSPPHGRGKVFSLFVDGLDLRITPA